MSPRANPQRANARCERAHDAHRARAGSFDDFDRFFNPIAQFDAGSTPHRIGEILEAVQILTHSPLIGRPVKDGKRELVIGRDARGYLALYRYVAAIDTVFLLALRAQREARYKHEGDG